MLLLFFLHDHCYVILIRQRKQVRLTRFPRQSCDQGFKKPAVKNLIFSSLLRVSTDVPPRWRSEISRPLVRRSSRRSETCDVSSGGGGAEGLSCEGASPSLFSLVKPRNVGLSKPPGLAEQTRQLGASLIALRRHRLQTAIVPDQESAGFTDLI